jgi:hypothetical protein
MRDVRCSMCERPSKIQVVRCAKGQARFKMNSSRTRLAALMTYLERIVADSLNDCRLIILKIASLDLTYALMVNSDLNSVL